MRNIAGGSGWAPMASPKSRPSCSSETANGSPGGLLALPKAVA